MQCAAHDSMGQRIATIVNYFSFFLLKLGLSEVIKIIEKYKGTFLVKFDLKRTQ